MQSNLDSSISGTRPRRSRRILRALAVLAIPLALAGATASVALAHGDGPDGHGAFLQHRMDHLLDVAGASDAQRAQVKTIWQAARPQLKAAHQEAAGLRRQIGDAMAAPNIDAAHIEQLRKQSVQAMDHVSAVVTQAMVQSAQVLTPAQRQKVLAEIRAHQHEHGFRGGDSE